MKKKKSFEVEALSNDFLSFVFEGTTSMNVQKINEKWIVSELYLKASPEICPTCKRTHFYQEKLSCERNLSSSKKLWNRIKVNPEFKEWLFSL